MIPKVVSQSLSVLERLKVLKPLDPDHLVIGEGDTSKRPTLRVKVEAINKTEAIEVAILSTEEIASHQILVASDKGSTTTRVLPLDSLLDPRVFRDVKEPLIVGALLGDCTVPAVERRIQSMTHLVQDEEVIEVLAHRLPLGKDQSTTLDIEHGGLDIRTMLDGNIFRREELGEPLLRGNGNVCQGFCLDHQYRVYRSIGGKSRDLVKKDPQ